MDTPLSYTEKFIRTEMVVGRVGMEKLMKARITVVGLGAVGSYAVEVLARLGIGNLRLVDFDVVKPSNTNRQLYALNSTMGRKKIVCANERVLDINPDCRVETFDTFFHTGSIDSILEPPPDVLLDAIDGLNPKVALLAACVNKKIPVVSSMGAACRTNPYMIRAGDIGETTVCPLATRIKKRLKKMGVYAGVRCIYSIEKPVVTKASIIEEDEVYEHGRKREPLGSLSFVTGMFGILGAYEVYRLVI
jgi:tRNA A37 threonylcarbamoyladenosine dehydratase